VPEAIKKQGLLRVGVKCDYPPDGYLDAQGRPQGVEVSLAKQIAAYAFGSPDKVELACVTAANRIPSLQRRHGSGLFTCGRPKLSRGIRAIVEPVDGRTLGSSARF